MLDPHVDTAEIAVASWRSLLVVVFRQPRSVASLEAMARAEEDLIRRVGRIQVLSLVPPVAFTLPDAAIREKTDVITRRFASSLSATAIVIQGTGLGVSLTRSFVTAATMLMREVPTRVFDHVPDGLVWLGGRPGQGFGLAAVTREIAIDVASLATRVGLSLEEPARRVGRR